MAPDAVMRSLTQNARRLLRIATDLPESFSRLLKRAGQGEFRIVVEPIGLDPIMKRARRGRQPAGVRAGGLGVRHRAVDAARQHCGAGRGSRGSHGWRLGGRAGRGVVVLHLDLHGEDEEAAVGAQTATGSWRGDGQDALWAAQEPVDSVATLSAASRPHRIVEDVQSVLDGRRKRHSHDEIGDPPGASSADRGFSKPIAGVTRRSNHDDTNQLEGNEVGREDEDRVAPDVSKYRIVLDLARGVEVHVGTGHSHRDQLPQPRVAIPPEVHRASE